MPVEEWAHHYPNQHMSHDIGACLQNFELYDVRSKWKDPGAQQVDP